MSYIRLVTSVVAIALVTGSASAQRVRPDAPPGGRGALEQRFRERFAEVVRERVGLNDEQMTQLVEVNRRFETRRRDLLSQERSVRLELRRLLAADGAEDQGTQDRVAQLLQQGLRVQRQRLDLVEEEDRAISGFMSPVQRARYLGMQEQMRRRVEDLRRGAEGGDSAAGPPYGGRGLRRRPGIPPRP